MITYYPCNFMSNKSSQQVTQQVRAIYADPYASAVVAEYVVVKVNCVNGVVDSKRRLQKVEVPENIVSRTSDPWKILDSLGLDDKWLSHVKEALVELHGRRDKWLGGASAIGPQRDEESTTASAAPIGDAGRPNQDASCRRSHASRPRARTAPDPTRERLVSCRLFLSLDFLWLHRGRQGLPLGRLGGKEKE